MVYVMNAQDCYRTNLREFLPQARNRLFTAITRSKSWVRVLGVGEAMERLTEEYKQVVERSFRLEFDYPTAEQRKKLRVISRGLRTRRGSRNQMDLVDLIDALDAGDLDIDTLPAEVKERLLALLQQGKR